MSYSTRYKVRDLKVSISNSSFESVQTSQSMLAETRLVLQTEKRSIDRNRHERGRNDVTFDAVATDRRKKKTSRRSDDRSTAATIAAVLSKFKVSNGLSFKFHGYYSSRERVVTQRLLVAPTVANIDVVFLERGFSLSLIPAIRV